MVTTVRLVKGKSNWNKGFTFGATGAGWFPKEFLVNIPPHVFFVDLKEGDVNREDGSPVPLTEVLDALLSVNKKVVGVSRTGRFSKPIYGEDHKWFIDYQPGLKDFFQKNQLPIPQDEKGIGERYLETSLAVAKEQGLISSSYEHAFGRKAIEEAKKQHEEEANKLREENEALKKQLIAAGKGKSKEG